MAFSSAPIYLDPPNWQQQQQLGIVTESGSQLSPTMPPPPAIGGGGTCSTRPGSLADRARLAKIITQPETALKCPRCESTNTKFCYFNNYSLSQPRHFCKTCRRYWTRGGALRSVPVGGGCRRNKRSTKGNTRSKSPLRGEKRNISPSSANATTSNNIIMSHLPSPPPHNLSFLPTPLHNFSDFSSTENGLHFGGNIQPQGGTSDHQMSLSTRFADQFRFQQMQQFPFFSPLEQPSNLYQFQAVEYDHAGATNNIGSKAFESDEVRVTNVKAEENKSDNNSQGLNLSRNNVGVTSNQFWTDISGYNSTSTSQLL